MWTVKLVDKDFDAAEFLRNNQNFDMGDCSFTVVAQSEKDGIHYLAVKCQELDGTDAFEIFAVIVATELKQFDEDWIFSFNITVEHHAPRWKQASEEVLNSLTETDDPNALRWRLACRRNLWNIQNNKGVTNGKNYKSSCDSFIRGVQQSHRK